LAHGNTGQRIDGFLAVSLTDEDGWREHSATHLRQIFAEVGWHDDLTRLRLTLSGADNTLNGTQARPVSLLDAPRTAYTWRDWTTNRLLALNLTAAHAVSEAFRTPGNARGFWLGVRARLG